MKAIICDIDGTLALKGDRNPFDWGRVGEDRINNILRNIVTLYYMAQYQILLVSGRDECCRLETKRWLAEHEISYHALYMRPHKNYERDTVIKTKIYEDHIKNNFDVEFVLDDRDCVVKMWRSLGLTCLQVAEGDF